MRTIVRDGVARVLGQELCLAEGGTKSGIFNAELVYKGTTLLPTAICLISGSKGGVQQLRARLEGFNVLISALPKSPLSLSILFCTLAGTQSAAACGTGRR